MYTYAQKKTRAVSQYSPIEKRASVGASQDKFNSGIISCDPCGQQRVADQNTGEFAMVMITVEMPAQVEEQARRLGLLSGERVAALIEAEVDRLQQEAGTANRLQVWQELEQAFEPAREAFRAEYAHLTDDQVMDMINDVVHEVRADMELERRSSTPAAHDTASRKNPHS